MDQRDIQTFSLTTCLQQLKLTNIGRVLLPKMLQYKDSNQKQKSENEVLFSAAKWLKIPPGRLSLGGSNIGNSRNSNPPPGSTNPPNNQPPEPQHNQDPGNQHNQNLTKGDIIYTANGLMPLLRDVAGDSVQCSSGKMQPVSMTWEQQSKTSELTISLTSLVSVSMLGQSYPTSLQQPSQGRNMVR